MKRTLPALCLSVVLTALAGCRSAYWSPDGKTLALDPEWKLRLFDVATRKFRSVETGSPIVVSPTWSRDSKSLAYYTVTAQDGKPKSVDLWVRDVASGEERKLSADLVPEALLLKPSTQPAPAPDGEAPAVPPMPPDPVKEAAGQVKLAMTIAWSPDGKRIVHTRTVGEDGRLEIVDVAAATATVLEADVRAQHAASWSPDGKRLAFFTNPRTPGEKGEGAAAPGEPAEDPPSSLMVADADGKNARKVWGDPKEAKLLEPFPATWTADGARLVFYTQKQGVTDFQQAFVPEVRVVPAAGGKSTVLTQFSSPIGMVRPDLSAVIYLGGKDWDTVVYKKAPFKTSKILDKIAELAASAGPPRIDGPEPGRGEGHPPTVLLSPDGKLGALLYYDTKAKRSELRLYDLATGKKSLYPVQ